MEGWRDEWDSPVMGKMNQQLGGDFNGLSLKKLKRRLTHGAELDEVLCAFSPLSFSLGFHLRWGSLFLSLRSFLDFI